MFNDKFKTYDEFNCGRTTDPIKTVENCFMAMKRCKEPLLDNIHFASVGRICSELFFQTPLIYGTPNYSFWTKTSMVSGKGPSLHLALASGLMEFLERYSFHKYISTKSIFIGPSKDLKNNNFEIKDLENTGSTQKFFEGISSDKWNSFITKWYNGFRITLEDDDIKLEDVKIPLNLIFNDFEGNNGIATGNNIEEAMVHGLCEIVERDCQSKFLLDDKTIYDFPIILPETIDNTIIQTLYQIISKDSVSLVLIDCSSIHGIPAVSCVRQLPNSKFINIVGTSTSKTEAIIRALTETIQLSSNIYHHLNGWDSLINKITTPKRISYKDMIDISDNNIKNEIKKLLKNIEKSGSKIYFSDTTDKDEINVPVVYIYASKLQTIVPTGRFLSKNLHELTNFYLNRAANVINDGISLSSAR